MATPRNGPCHCGSEQKYKNCHYLIDAAGADGKYAAAQTVYARNWRSTSEGHAIDGVYDWIANQIGEYQPHRIFDVGCGTGQGLVGLLKRFGPHTQIVAIDENLKCLEMAMETIRAECGIDAQLLARSSINESARGWIQTFGPLAIDPAAQVTLIESDVFLDPHLETALAATGPFDAVTVWLTGFHMFRARNVGVLDTGITSERSHRIILQNASYELADKILKPSGVLQVVDRGQAPDTPELKEEYMELHREQASVTSLEVIDATYRRYEESESDRTTMMLSAGTAPTPDELSLAYASVISRKP